RRSGTRGRRRPLGRPTTCRSGRRRNELRSPDADRPPRGGPRLGGARLVRGRAARSEAAEAARVTRTATHAVGRRRWTLAAGIVAAGFALLATVAPGRAAAAPPPSPLE